MKKPELLPLTGIRFYAALLVFVAHTTEFPGLEWLREIHFFKVAGSMGVSVFFVLSGFILTYNYAAVFAGGVTGKAWRAFVWQRLAKIYPTHLLTLLIAIPLQVFSPNLPLDWRAVPVQLLLVQCFVPFGTPPLHAYLNAPSWSISCEFFFYLLAPFGICGLGKGGRKAASVAAVAGYAAVVCAGLSLLASHHHLSNSGRLTDGGLFAYLDHRYFTYYFAPTRFLEFLGGILVAFAYLRKTGGISPVLTTLYAGLAILLLTAGAWMQQLFSWPLQDAFDYLPGAALLIYILARGSGWVAAHLSGRRMEVLGMASFSFYMIHMPVIRCVRGVMRHFDVLSPSPTVIAATVIGTFLAAQVCAILLCRHFELPVQKWMKNLTGHPPTTG